MATVFRTGPAVIVIALIAAGAAQMVTYRPRRGEAGPDGGRTRRWRTGTGRLTRAADGLAEPIEHAAWYFPIAVVVIAGAAAAAAYPWP